MRTPSWKPTVGAWTALGVLALASPFAAAQTDTTLSGKWATQGFGSIVQFKRCADAPENMCGRIIWLWETNDEHGQPRVDGKNPKRALRNRSLVGVEIVRDLRETSPGVWSNGALYNPDDGRTYTGTVRLKDGALELRGCALSVFCQTQTWRRPGDVFASVERLPE